jgi:peptidoglycan-associated lipoprotein
MRKVLLFAAAIISAGAASAQVRLPVIVPLRGSAQARPGPLAGIDALRAEFIARSGSDLAYFSGDSVLLSPQSRATLGAQAQWLRLHPEVLVRIEGHADVTDTRDHALAVGARRAQEVRDYLVLMGVPAPQLSITSWGKDKPGPARTQTVLVGVIPPPVAPPRNRGEED